MEQGLYIRQNNEYIEKVTQSSAKLSLIAKGDGNEVMFHKILKDRLFYIYPSDNSETMEFFYVVEGVINYDKNIILKKGDYFYTHDLIETVYFKAITDVTLLYVSTQPVFHFLSDTINELTRIVKKVQIKDMYTYNHSTRVQDYSVKIAKQLHISKEKLDNFNFASLFHDIGKVHVPDKILNKPGRLTHEEMEIIKKHPIDGAEMVKETYYKEASKIIEQHHERLDGSGYPYGLKGDEILFEARIIAVADTYDAMTTDRPYRRGFAPKIALAELKKLSGVHYDQRVVKAFEEILKDEGVVK